MELAVELQAGPTVEIDAQEPEACFAKGEEDTDDVYMYSKRYTCSEDSQNPFPVDIGGPAMHEAGKIQTIISIVMLYVCIYIYIYVCAHEHIHTQSIFIFMYMKIFMLKYTCICTYSSTYSQLINYTPKQQRPPNPQIIKPPPTP